MVTCRKRKLGWKSVVGCPSVNHSEEKESVGLESPSDTRSTRILTRSAPKIRAKKQKVMVQDNADSFSETKKDETENSERQSTETKTTLQRKVPHEGPSQLIPENVDDCPGIAYVNNSQVPADNEGGSEGVVTRNKVREALRLFQTVVRKLIQDDTKSKAGGRYDTVASNQLKRENKWVNTGKQILGSVPGVEVGDEFHFRAELAVVGLHRPFQSGIDYLSKESLATSIVASCRGYVDDMGSSDVLRYSGQGGIPIAKKKAEDQKLVRGNLALKNSMERRSPVRVIRGYKEKCSDLDESKFGKTYVYDGLYLVENYSTEVGPHGNNIFVFELRRIPGQPKLALREVGKSEKSKVRKGLCVDDISQGKEKMKICAINNIDDEKPPSFNYITNMIYPSLSNHSPPASCECTDGCSDSRQCMCVVRNGGEIPYNNDGAIVEAEGLVYECGPSCKCPPSCHNRVSQHGIKFPLEIFKTDSRGWGVRSRAFIPSGSFICEYTGELLQDKEAEEKTNDEYLFDIGNNYNGPRVEGLASDTKKKSSSSRRMEADLKTGSSSKERGDEGGFVIDAAQQGNIGRFINHSCTPNLYAENVFYDHDDKRMPHIMFFAAKNIRPLQELSYDYNYLIGEVLDSDGKIKKKVCYCGSKECKGRLY